MLVVDKDVQLSLKGPDDIVKIEKVATGAASQSPGLAVTGFPQQRLAGPYSTTWERLCDHRDGIQSLAERSIGPGVPF